MPDLFNLTPEMQSYFDTLPTGIQQIMIMSGTKINNLEDMKAVVTQLTGDDNEKEKL